MRRVNHAADVQIKALRPSDFDPAHAVGHQRCETVERGRFDVYALHGNTCLAGIGERADHQRGRGLLQRRLLEDDHRVLPPELQRAGYEPFGGGDGDIPACSLAAGKRDVVDMPNQVASDLRTAVDHLEKIRIQSAFDQ